MAFSAVFTCGALPAACEDYPYTGLFVVEIQGNGGDRLAERCALSFLEQRKEGDWSSYHLDLEEFRSTGTIRYLELANGTCTFDPRKKVESCTAKMDKSYPEGEGMTVFDVILKTTPDRIDTALFQDIASLMEGLSNTDSGVAQTFLRCPFPAERMLSLRTSGVTDLSKEDAMTFRNAPDELLSDPAVRAVVAKLQAD